MTVSRRFYNSILAGALLALTVPAAAVADNGVLLSGYAPPAAGDQAILGVANTQSAATGATGATGSAPAAPSRAQLSLAQPSAANGAGGAAAAGGTGTHARAGGKQGSNARRSAGRTAAQLPAAPAAIAAAAAADRSSGSIFSWWQLALAAGLAILTTVLARGWRRDDG